MIFIYGGAFIEGYSEEVNYGPHHLMDENVILVSFNYRVGPFGKQILTLNRSLFLVGFILLIK